ncbi:Putative aliphatic sulfonates transport permease protein SsuC [Sporomusa ovata DSM 2662]|uniref:ABC-type nitrate/sulfonate/bicarbonate transport system, permease component n=1 Tax=Sporomusa ovata TaxID=2378 RepID=A0A0U1KW98_9FIRM|nr:ABC transporter permease [Sporomusa ovata]EQB27079.1 ABC-type nitrate/sulfonate/bicarbonate transport system, permease component [Sporomusa ovata DSM 2662]CQR71183.1 ABC-type nitrate/sulfonate/bicarbonate transport system, permease component [Sporomusa ovata]
MGPIVQRIINITILPVLFLGIWQAVAVNLANPVILPAVSDVFVILAAPNQELLSLGSMAQNIAVSLWRVLAGFVLAALLAVPLGILMGYSRSVFDLLNHFFGLLRPIPPLAWVPLVLAWFGVASLANVLGVESGEAYLYLRNIKVSMVFIIFIGAFFPIITSTIYGVQSVRKILLDTALVLGAGRRDVFVKILLPAAAPAIVSGMRIGLGVAWMCLVAAEMLPGSIAGVGYLITHAYTIARTDIVIAGMISIGAIGAALDASFRAIADRKFAWQRLAR